MVGLILSTNVFADTSYNINTNNSVSGNGNQVYGANPSGTATASNQQSTTTSDSNSSGSQSAQTAPNVTLSSSAKDQEDLSKLFDHAKYEDFAKQKPIGGFSVSSSDGGEEAP